MRVVVTGAAGMLGSRVARRLLTEGALGTRRVSHIVFVDAFAPPQVDAEGVSVETVVADLADEGVAEEVVSGRPEVIFHLAAVVSGEAEADLEKGYRVNVELMIEDYTRRGVLDGVCVRLPTICVRPGSANLAASGFFSSIIREPLNGATAILPVADDVRHWFASPRAAVGCLIHAATLALGFRAETSVDELITVYLEDDLGAAGRR
jgi:nucleoside-diphosphate-sugar epimerase